MNLSNTKKCSEVFNTFLAQEQAEKLSVVRHKFSHGNECEQELYEMADITDGIVDNVQGYLTAERVIEILEEER